MDFGLKEIGPTFIVGAFTILGLDFISHYLFGYDITGFFRGRLGFNNGSDGNTGENTISTTLFVMLSLSLGILAEDVSYKFMDGGWLPSWAPSYTWFTKAGNRTDALVEEDKEGNLLPKQLGIDLSYNKAFTSALSDKECAKEVERWFLVPEKISAYNTHHNQLRQKIDRAINALYYFAKNTVYKEDNHYNEMRIIQSRLELSRSIILISYSYLLFAILSIIAQCFYALFIKKKIGYLNGCRVVSTLVIVYLLSLLAYERESDEFDKRAFGYFSTMLIKLDKTDH
jgi:hypothetical protein